MKKIYGDNPNEYISKRVERELNIINGKGYSIIY
jgi:DNA polymerase III alpha subunit (gram-positive type)